MLIEPYTSVGNLLFTDSRKQIREKLNEIFESGSKGFSDIVDYYDYFKQSELFVCYDKYDNVNAFEFFKSNPVFNNINLLDQPYKKLIKELSILDGEIEVEYNYFTSYKYGIGGNTNEDPELDESMPEAVIVFRKGYYDSLKLDQAL